MSTSRIEVPTSISNDSKEYSDKKNENNKRPRGATPPKENSKPSTPTTQIDDHSTSIKIIDGTKKIRYGTEYWVQRNVITVQVISHVPFDEVRVFCHKKGANDPKLMEILPYFEHYKSHGIAFETSFKKKLPHTSGRPETQKPIWLTAEFYKGGNIIKSSSTEPFFVCSRPGNDTASEKESVSPVNAASIIQPNKSKRSSFLPLTSIQPNPIAMVSPLTSSRINASMTSSFPLLKRYSSLHLPNTSPFTSPVQSPRTTPIHMSRGLYQASLSPKTFRTSPTTAFTSECKSTFAIVDISPARGSNAGGFPITISVSNIDLNSARDVTVFFGLLPASQIRIIDDHTLTVIAPARFIPGDVKVSIVVDGCETCVTGVFKYTDANTLPLSAPSNVQHVHYHLHHVQGSGSTSQLIKTPSTKSKLPFMSTLRPVDNNTSEIPSLLPSFKDFCTLEGHVNKKSKIT
jgi:hypothetical protein